MVDIGTTVFNRPKHTEVFLQSIINSDMKDYRLFILDQNSNQETYDVIQKYSASRSNFIHIRSKENLGMCGGRAYLVSIMSSKYCVITDNDVVLPKQDLLQPMVDVLDRYNDITAVCPRPTTAGLESIVGRCMFYQNMQSLLPEIESGLRQIDVTGGVFVMHRRDNLISSNAWVIPKNQKWSAYDHLLCRHFSSSGWKLACIMDKFVDLQDEDETWGYGDSNAHGGQPFNPIWANRPKLLDGVPLWYINGIEDWTNHKEYIR